MLSMSLTLQEAISAAMDFGIDFPTNTDCASLSEPVRLKSCDMVGETPSFLSSYRGCIILATSDVWCVRVWPSYEFFSIAYLWFSG